MRLLTQSVLRWPSPEMVLQQLQAWMHQQQTLHPNLQRVGVYGSYGRGTATVGSDLDLLLVDTHATGPQMQRLQHWPWSSFPSAATPWCSRPANWRSCSPAPAGWQRLCGAICAGCNHTWIRLKS